MELVVLGSGTAAPSARRGAPSFLVRAGGQTCLVDTGPGCLRQLACLGIGLSEIEHIFFTHTHLDHVNDLWAFIFACNVPWMDHPNSVYLYGSKEFICYYQRVSEALGRDAVPRAWELLPRAVDGRVETVGTATVRSFAVRHTASSVGYRFEHEGRSLVLSGDTDVGEDLVAGAMDADLLVLECSTPDEAKVEGHLTPRLCGEVAARARVKRLVLTHLYPSCDGVDVVAGVRGAYAGEVEVAEDLRRYTV